MAEERQYPEQQPVRDEPLFEPTEDVRSDPASLRRGTSDTWTRAGAPTNAEAYTSSAPPAVEESTGHEQETGEAKKKVEQKAHEAKRRGEETAARLRRRGEEMADAKKATLSGLLEEIGAAVDCAADRLKADHHDDLAGLIHQAADGVRGSSRKLRDRPTHDILDDANRLARRRPELVAGGMFLAGLALSRFVRAGAPHDGE